MTRHQVRLAGAVFAAGIAAIYYLIGLGVLQVIQPGTAEAGSSSIGYFAGTAFLIGALLLLSTDRRDLWLLGMLLQVLVVIGYLAVAPSRTPSFEIWGVTLRVLQVPLLLALAYLAATPQAAAMAHPTSRAKDGWSRGPMPPLVH